MFHRILLLLLTVTLSCTAARSQTMYRLIYGLPPEMHPSDAFFVMYDNGSGFVRINGVDGSRSEIQLMEDYATDANGNTDTSMLVYQGISGLNLNDSTPAGLLSYWFRLDPATSMYRPFAVTTPTQSGTPATSNIQSDSLLNASLLTPVFLKKYFSVKEDFYLSRFGPRSRGGLTIEEQKTKFFLIVVASTHDETIGPAVDLDAQKAIRMFDTVAMSLGIRNNLIIDTVFGDQYSKANVLNAINKLKPAKQDIVVFYYTGHGYTDTTQPNRNYPFMDLRDPRIRPVPGLDHSNLNIEDIYESIRIKGARINLVIGDCCNDKMNSYARILPPPPRPGRPRGDTTLSIDNLKALFLPKQPQSILLAAASKYEKAFTNTLTGSFYTNNLFQTLRTRFYPQPEKVSWQGIMATAQKLTVFQVAAKKNCPVPNNPDGQCHQTPLQKVN